MNSAYLDSLKERKAKIEEAINNVLEAGQEFQTRNGRVKQVPLSTLRQELNSIEMEINALEHSGYTDTQILVFRGCK